MQSRSASRHPLLILAATVVAATAVIGVRLTSASAASPAPAYIVITDVTSTVHAPTDTPPRAVPSALVEEGAVFTVHVAFFDSTGAEASFSKDTTLSVTANTGSDNQPVEVDWTAYKDDETAKLTSTIAQSANQVRLTVSVPKSKQPRVEGTVAEWDVFDVLDEIRFEDSTTNFRKGIGGKTDCTEATQEAPVCGVLILPEGAASDQVLLSLGACDSTYAGCAGTRGSVVQALANLAGLYDTTHPATLLLKCDKTLCKTGSIQSKVVNFSSNGNDALSSIEACPAKNTAFATGGCVDYVQSNRDGSGDTHFYVLFVKDARVSVR